MSSEVYLFVGTGYLLVLNDEIFCSQNLSKVRELFTILAVLE